MCVYYGNVKLYLIIKFMWIDNEKFKYDSIILKNGDCFYFEKF